MGGKKTARHKGDNTFKFETFKDQLRDVRRRYNVQFKDTRLYGVENTSDTSNFYQALTERATLDLSESYKRLVDELGPSVQTLTQVLHEKKRIFRLVLGHLKDEANISSLESVLELIRGLATDLDGKFVPKLRQFVKAIFGNILTTRLTLLIQQCFYTVEFLFLKFRKSIQREFPRYVNLLLPMWNSSNKAYVVMFTAESFKTIGVKFWKQNPKNFLPTLNEIVLRPQPTAKHGVARLLASMIENTLTQEESKSLVTDCLMWPSSDVEIWCQTTCLVIKELSDYFRDNKISITVFRSCLQEQLAMNVDSVDVFMEYLIVLQSLMSEDKSPEFSRLAWFTTIATSELMLRVPASQQILTEIMCTFIRSELVSSNLEEALREFVKRIEGPPLEELSRAISKHLPLYPYATYLVERYNSLDEYILAELGPTGSRFSFLASEAISYAMSAGRQSVGLKFISDRHAEPAYYRRSTQASVSKKFTLPMSTLEIFDSCAIMDMVKEKSAMGAENLLQISNGILRFFITLNNIKFTSPGCEHCYSASLEISNNFITCITQSQSEEEERKLWELLFHSVQISPKFDLNGIRLNASGFLQAAKFRISYEFENEDLKTMSIWALKGFDEVLFKALATNFLNSKEISSDPLIRRALINNLRCGFKTVRGLSLSVLYQLEQESVIKSVLEVCLRIEELRIHDISFTTSANEDFERLKVMSANGNLVPIITNFTLGYMFTNFKLVWPKCVEILKMCLATDVRVAWDDGVSFAFKNIHADPLTPLIPIEISEFNENDFVGRLAIGYFSWIEYARTMDDVATLDCDTYRVNLWSAVEGINESNSVAINSLFQKAGEIIDGFKLKFPFLGLDKNLESKGLRRCLVHILNFLVKSSSIGSDLNRSDWFTRLVDLLVSPDEIKRTVVKIILRVKSKEISRFGPYLEEIYSVESIPRTLQDLKSIMKREKVKDGDKEVLMEVLTRLLIQKMKYSEPKYRTEVLSSVASHCRGDSNVDPDMSLMESLIRLSLQFSYTRSDYNDNTVILKLFQKHVSLIQAMLVTWRYQFVDQCQQALRLLCEMTKFVKTLRDDNLAALRKQALSSARDCLDSYFKLFGKAPLPTPVVQNIFRTFVWPAIRELDVSASTNIRRILKLFLVWSQEARYRYLFMEKNEDDGNEAVYQAILRLLSRDSTTTRVKVFLLQIIFNLLTPDNMYWVDEEITIENKGKRDKLVPVLPRLINPFEVGQKIIKLGKQEIVGALKDSAVFRDLCVRGNNAQLYTGLLASLASCLGDTELLTTFCGIIIGSLRKTKPDAEIVASCCQALKEAVADPIIDQVPVLTEILQLFTWAKTHELKRELYRIVLTWRHPVFQPILMRLCSSVVNLMDKSTDLKSLYDGYKDCLQLVESDNQTDLLFLEFVTHHCFLIAEVPPHVDSNEARQSVPLMHAIVKRIASDIKNHENLSLPAKDFIRKVLVPSIKNGIDTENGFSNILEIIFVSIVELGDVHGMFRELKFLVDLGILSDLDDIQVNRKTLALNKLANALKDSDRIISAGTLFNIIKPLVERNLLKERTQKMAVNINELVDSSIEVLKCVLLRLPHNMYLKVLTHILNKRTNNKSIMNQLERILTAILDSYHYDLSLAVAPPKESEEQGEGEDDQEESDDEEVTPSAPIANLNLTLVQPEAAAQKFLRELEGSIVPDLIKCLNGAPITGHKLSDSVSLSEEGVAKRFAYAKALVKLCCKLPHHKDSDIWNMIIPKLCSDVKSKHDSVRNSARQSLIESLKEMGLTYFNTAFSYLQANLQRGYQKHVLHFTIAQILTTCHDEIKACSKPLPIRGILKLCFDEVFSPIREEKGVVAVTSKTFEAKKDNAKIMLEACGEFSHDVGLLSTALEMGLEKVTQSADNALATRNWLKNFGFGLLKNEVLPKEQILIWLGTQLEKYSEVDSSSEKEAKRLTRKRKSEGRQSTLLIKGIDSQKIKSSRTHNSQQVAEFVFCCLHDTLKNMELSPELASSFVPYLVDALVEHSRTVNILATKCLTFFIEQSQPAKNKDKESDTRKHYSLNEVFKFDRDESTLNSIWRKTFMTMATFSTNPSDDQALVNSVFKCITTFLGTFPKFKILKDDFIVLINSIKTYLTFGNCSSSAVKLAKGMINRNLKSEELPDLMKMVKELSVTSHMDHIVESCRGLYLEYILAYCKSLDDCAEEISYYAHYMKSSDARERKACLLMLMYLVQKLPEAMVKELHGVYFTILTVGLCYETNPQNKQVLSNCLKTFMHSTDGVTKTAKSLFALMSKVGKDSHAVIAQIGGWLIAEGWDFMSKPATLKISQLYAEVLNPENKSESAAVKLTLFAVRKIFRIGFKSDKLWNPDGFAESILNDIMIMVKDHYLMNTDVWIRSLAMGFYGDVLNRLNLERLFAQLEGLTDSSEYCSVISNIMDLDSMIGLHTKIFESEQQLATQLFEPAKSNLQVLMKIAIYFYNHPQSGEHGKSLVDGFLIKLIRLANYEVTKYPKESAKRLLVYSLFEYLIAEGGELIIQGCKKRVMRVALRDSTDSNTPREVKLAADGLCDQIRKKIGEQVYQKVYVAVLQKLQDERLDKRAKKRENAVLHPETVRKRRKTSKPSSGTKSKSPRYRKM